MSQTRALARLPGVDIEIRHREAPEEGAEYLRISIKATPDFRTAMRWLDPFATMSLMAAANPWLAWQRSMAAMMAPFLAAPTRSPFLAERREEESPR